MTDEQILPMGPVQKAIRAQNRRITLLQEQVDALQALVDSARSALEAHYEAFLRHTHNSGLKVENAVNEAESTQERERHA